MPFVIPVNATVDLVVASGSIRDVIHRTVLFENQANSQSLSIVQDWRFVTDRCEKPTGTEYIFPPSHIAPRTVEAIT